MNMRNATLLLLAALMLAACGNKGPLVLPSREAPDLSQDEADPFEQADEDDADEGEAEADPFDPGTDG